MALNPLILALKAWLVGNGFLSPEVEDPMQIKEVAMSATVDGKLSVEELANIKKNAKNFSGEKFMAGPSVGDIVQGSGGAGGGRVEVKKASDRYQKTQPNVVHKSTGRPVDFMGRTLAMPSELQLAKIGVFFKHLMASGQNRETLTKWGMAVPELNEHERQLVTEMYHEDAFCGLVGGQKWLECGRIENAGLNVKSLLNDSTSGGSNLVPFDFDQAVVTYALLHSEILPYVDMRQTVRDQVQTASIGNVTVTWGTPEGTAISLFDTDSLIGNITADVHNCTVALLYGRDLEADTPVAELGAILQSLIGQAYLKDMDRVICLGNGTSEPEGFFNASGVSTVSSDNSSAGPPTIDDYLSLAFAVGKQYRTNSAMGCCFISNDTTYQRVRSIPAATYDVGGNTINDQRLALGMNVSSYQTLDWPHRIQNDITNAKLGFVALKKYCLWRRSGFEFFLTREGSTLARRNENLLVARGRFAGKFVDHNAAAFMTDCQS